MTRDPTANSAVGVDMRGGQRKPSHLRETAGPLLDQLPTQVVGLLPLPALPQRQPMKALERACGEHLLLQVRLDALDRLGYPPLLFLVHPRASHVAGRSGLGRIRNISGPLVRPRSSPTPETSWLPVKHSGTSVGSSRARPSMRLGMWAAKVRKGPRREGAPSLVSGEMTVSLSSCAAPGVLARGASKMASWKAPMVLGFGSRSGTLCWAASQVF